MNVDDCRIQAKQGDVDAQFILGFMYANGKGVSQNDMEAVKWFKKAAEQGLYPVNALWAN
jgi:FOG: TPR repeat, SEL1 subfamily